MELPGYYLLDAKIYPQDTKYVMKVIKYAIPKTCKKIQTHAWDSEPITQKHAEVYSGSIYKPENCGLQLQVHTHSHLESETPC